MLDPKPKKSTRDKVQETLTPQRLSVASWAVAAILFGSVGVASVQFANAPGNFGNRFATGGLPLPAPGPVSTTASVNTPYTVGIGSPQVVPFADAKSTELASHLETLQLQVVAMRRRLETLSEQNRIYSTRIAALEDDLRTSNQMASAASEPPQKSVTVRTAVQFRDTPNELEQQIAHTPAPMPKEGQPQDESFVVAQSPVTLVTLPTDSTPPTATGSIDPSQHVAMPEEKPQIILPSKPVGRLNTTGGSSLNSSAFGAAIGTYKTREDAIVAWGKFKEQNDERMRDLQPLLASEGTADAPLVLLVGPFGNAADAAVACLRLLEVSDTCYPAIFSGDALTATTARN